MALRVAPPPTETAPYLEGGRGFSGVSTTTKTPDPASVEAAVAALSRRPAIARCVVKMVQHCGGMIFSARETRAMIDMGLAEPMQWHKHVHPASPTNLGRAVAAVLAEGNDQ